MWLSVQPKSVAQEEKYLFWTVKSILVKGNLKIYFCLSPTTAITAHFHFLLFHSWLETEEEGLAWDLLAIVRGESVLISY